MTVYKHELRSEAERLAAKRDKLNAKIEKIEAELSDLAADREITRWFGQHDDYQDGDVLRVNFRFRGGARVYTYVLLNVNGRWFSTELTGEPYTDFRDMALDFIEHKDGEIISVYRAYWGARYPRAFADALAAMKAGDSSVLGETRR